MKKKLYYLMGVDKRGLIVEAIGRLHDILQIARRWDRQDIAIGLMKEYRREGYGRQAA